MAEQKKSAPLADHDLRNINAIADALVEIEAKKNVVTLSEFSKFFPLFQNKSKDTGNIDNLVDLTTEFIVRFNPYASIKVVDHSRHLLFTIPKLFIPVNDISKEYDHLVNKFYKEGGSDIPRYAAEATYGIIDAIVKSQVDITDERYTDYIQKLSDEYAKDAHSLDKVKAGESDRFDEESDLGLVDDNDGDTDNLSPDDVDGISWD